MCQLFLHSFIPIQYFFFFLKKKSADEKWDAELVRFPLGLLEEGLSKVSVLVKRVTLPFQIQNIKQTNSALKEKLEGGIEQYRLPEVGSFSDPCLLWR